jgi:glyoxylase-like metal-dependent hydrolase (beta-lactamase superfamily II)
VQNSLPSAPLRSTLGDFELTVLSDGEYRLDGGAYFGIIPRVLWEKKVPTDEKHRVRAGLNSLLVRTGKHTVLIETGIGPKLDERMLRIYSHQPKLMESLAAAGVAPDDIDVVINTHLHFDHCGGNHLFAGRPIYVQRRELDDALSEDGYTIREWVEAPGVRYEPVDGELELLPGLRLIPAPGHTRGLQVVVVETGGRPVVVGGDVAVRFSELDEPRTEGQLRVRALEPELVWLAHEHEPWRPRTM